MTTYPPLHLDGWMPSPRAIAAGRSTHVPYDDGPAWDGGTHCGGSLLPGARALKEALLDRFPGIDSIGGYSCRQNTANAAQTSMHGSGRALDIMIRPLGPGRPNLEVGNQVADWLVTYADWIGVQLVIWCRNIWSPVRPDRFTGYGGPVPHLDHIHAEVTLAAAAQRTPFFTTGLQLPPERQTASWKRALVVASSIVVVSTVAWASRDLIESELLGIEPEEPEAPRLPPPSPAWNEDEASQ